MKHVVLVADDDDYYRDYLSTYLAAADYEVRKASNPDEARAELRKGGIDVAILDVYLTKGSEVTTGLQLAAEEAPDVEKIFVTVSEQSVQKAIEELKKVHILPFFRTEGPEVIVREIRKRVPARVFLAHGHSARKDSVALLMIEEMKLKPIIMQNDWNTGGSLLKGLEHYRSRVDAAVVVLTADDEGRLKGTKSLDARARENVIFELGFFVAALGGERVFALIENGITPPSNYQGLKYIDFDLQGGWKGKLRDALQHAGIRLPA